MGSIATTIYSIRNFGKAQNGDVGRLPVALVQSANSMSQATQNIINKVDDLGRWAEVGNNVGEAAGKVSKFASKITNPLLVGAAGIRVLKDEDKESALIEEGLAMSGMFTAEGIYKVLNNTIKDGAGKTLKENQKLLTEGPLAKGLKSLGEKISKMSSGKQKALLILGELGLVATSIVSYNLFKNIGKKLTGRDRAEKEKNEVKNNPFNSNAVSNLSAAQTGA